MMPAAGLRGFKIAFSKPLIPSGPQAAAANTLDTSARDSNRRPKSPFNKRTLDRFRKILISKRDELTGDVSRMESNTLGMGDGATKAQAVDDQGAEAADQALSLDLVAAERKLLAEIVAAIARIDNKSFGVCELTGLPIAKERLEELPWTRYSIEAARQLERRSLGS